MSSSRNREFYPWIKWWANETLHGSLASEPLEDLGFLLKLSCLAQTQNFHGEIKACNDIPYSHQTIAELLTMKLDDFEKRLQFQKNANRVSENERGIMTIINFKYYQHERGVPTTPKAKPVRLTDDTKEATALSNMLRFLDGHPNIEEMIKKGQKREIVNLLFRNPPEHTGETFVDK